MSFDESILKSDERAVYELRALYREYGYSQFKMSKFEEYDLYSENKDFLVSDGVITFNDTNGKLLALKPDVTLSILKNFKDEAGSTERLYYNENVYRISETSHTYKEIMQTGLECIGDINGDSEAEVIILALKSLSLISNDFVLDLSHVGLVSALLDGFALEGTQRKTALNAIVAKNGDLLKEVCGEELFGSLKCLIKSFKNAKDALSAVEKICNTDEAKQYAKELSDIYNRAENEGFGSNINIDFSIVDSAAYYSGTVFKGYIDGAESRVLSGGRYDGLMRKMGRRTGGIGFAVYLDMLERLTETKKEYDVDTLLLYDEDADIGALSRNIKMLTDIGTDVLAVRSIPDIKYRQLLKFNGKGVEICNGCKGEGLRLLHGTKIHFGHGVHGEEDTVENENNQSQSFGGCGAVV